MRKRALFLVAFTVLLSLILAACGSSGTTTSSSSGSMPGMNMGDTGTKPAATTAPAAAVTTAPVSAATTAPAMGATAGSMPGMAMGDTSNDPMTAALKDLKGMDFEIKFMQFMIGHHQSAIDMAKFIPTNTKRPELIKLGQEIITAQTKEIGDMTKWLADWYKAKPITDQMSIPGMMGMMGDNEKLGKLKDAEFDRLFLTMMIEHHQQAVSMSKLIPEKTQRAELTKLGQDIIKAQSTEIEQMMGWQKAWFKAS